MAVLLYRDPTTGTMLPLSSGAALPDGTIDGAPLVWDTTASAWIQGSPSSVSGMHQQDGLAITAGQFYFLLADRYGDKIAHVKVAARVGNQAQFFEFVSWNVSDNGVGSLALTGTAYKFGAAIFDQVSMNFHGGGWRTKIRALYTGTISIGWTITDELNASADLGPATIVVDTTGGTVKSTIAL